jgi:hypothetical protein
MIGGSLLGFYRSKQTRDSAFWRLYLLYRHWKKLSPRSNVADELHSSLLGVSKSPGFTVAQIRRVLEE